VKITRGKLLTEEELTDFYDRVQVEAKKAIAQAIERHRRLGESIAIWHNGEVMALSADKIPHIQSEL